MDTIVQSVFIISLLCLLFSMAMEISHLSKRIKKLEEDK